MITEPKADEILIQIGFTQLESEVYLYLLTEGAHTGYAVAKAIGKAVANVYKAIERLAQKGAVEQSSGKSKQCVALPWRQLITSETKKFNSNMDSLTHALTRLPEHQDDEQVYQIKNAVQVKDQAVRMVESAKHVILANVEPLAMTWLKEPLITAAARGVEVRIKVYEAVEIPGVTVVLRQNGSQVFDKTKDVQLYLCADGKEMLNALLTLDTNDVIQAFRSKSALMTLMLYNQILYELVLTELKDVIPNGDIKQAQTILKNTEHLHVFSSENSVFDNFNQKYEHLRE
jgi:sugar-specific transcriptional regulator TrmB